MKKKYLFPLFLIGIIILSTMKNDVKAYKLNNYPGVSNIGYVTARIDSSASIYSGVIPIGDTAWNIIPQVNVVNTTSSSATVTFIKLAYANGAYALVYAATNNTPNGTYQYEILLTPSFANLSTLKKEETISHEMGHVFGLAHTQPAYYNISIMRGDGLFNNDIYPRYDDMMAINDLY